MVQWLHSEVHPLLFLCMFIFLHSQSKIYTLHLITEDILRTWPQPSFLEKHMKFRQTSYLYNEHSLCLRLSFYIHFKLSSSSKSDQMQFYNKHFCVSFAKQYLSGLCLCICTLTFCLSSSHSSFSFTCCCQMTHFNSIMRAVFAIHALFLSGSFGRCHVGLRHVTMFHTS